MSNTFRNLRVYKIALDLLAMAQTLCRCLPKREFRQIDQLERATKSILANVAEGYGKRHYSGELLRYLSNALGSSDEVQAHLDIISLVPGVNNVLCAELKRRYQNLSVRLLNFIRFIKKTRNS